MIKGIVTLCAPVKKYHPPKDKSFEYDTNINCHELCDLSFIIKICDLKKGCA